MPSLQIQGIVQGVGLGPFVYGLAIEVEGPSAKVKSFAAFPSEGTGDCGA